MIKYIKDPKNVKLSGRRYEVMPSEDHHEYAAKMVAARLSGTIDIVETTDD